MDATDRNFDPRRAGGAGPGEPARWTGRTRGGRFGNWWFLFLIRTVGLWPAYGWLVFIAAYYTLAAREESRSSRDYLTRLLGPQPWWKMPWLVFRHFYSAGLTLLDRAAVIMGRANLACAYEGETAVLRLAADEQGVLLLGAHLGSWEMGSHLLARHGRPVNLVVLERDEPRIRELFAAALQAKQFQILTTDDDPLRSVPIMAALRRGEIVALHGDRRVGNTAAITIPFLGGQAAFPIGPYRLAAATGTPLVHAFAIRDRLQHYRFVSFPPQYVRRERGPAQDEIVRQCVIEYAAHLTELLRRYPFQWYNFYPFWEDDPPHAQP